MKNRSKADSTKDSLERAADTPALRRSTRSTRRPSNYSESKSPPKRKAAKETVVTVPASPPKRRAAKDAVVTVPAAMSEPRRNPKRKASIVTNRQVDLPDDLLEEALAPLTAEEIEEWAGWTELESEPVSKPSMQSCIILAGTSPFQAAATALILTLRASGLLQFHIRRSRC